MSWTDLIGWGSFALFAVFFFWLFKFITSPSRRLEKTLGDGHSFGLRKILSGSPEFQLLTESLRPFLAGDGKNFRLGSVYKRDGRNAYLFSMVEITKNAKALERSTHYQGREKLVWINSNALAPFAVRRRPAQTFGLGLAVKLLSAVGVKMESAVEGLTPQFQESFMVQAAGEGPVVVPAGLQQAFIDEDAAGVGYSGSTNVLRVVEAVTFTPDGFMVDLSSTLRPKTEEQLRQVIRFAERIEREIGPR